MSIYIGENKAILCKGDFEPAAIYKGDTFIAGAKNAAFEGETISADNTYNAPLSLEQTGKTEQAVTVQGKNLLDLSKWLTQVTGIARGTLNEKTNTSITFTSIAEDCCTIYYDGDNAFYIDVLPNTSYTFSYKKQNNVSGSAYIFFFDSLSNSYQSLVATGSSLHATFTTPSYCTRISFRLGILHAGYTEAFSEIQLELGATATAYEPFVPNSPSPDYPSEIKKVLSGTSIDVSDINDQIKYSATLDRDLRAIKVDAISDLCNYIDGNSQGWCSDYIKVENGVVKYVQRIGTYEFNGTESITAVVNNVDDVYRAVYNNFIFFPSEFTSLGVVYPLICSHFISASRSTTRFEGAVGFVSIWKSTSNYELQFGTTCTSAAEWNSFITNQYNSGNPVTVYHILATPIETDITDTELGQALLVLHSVPRHTNIYSVPETDGLSPYIKTTMKTY